MTALVVALTLLAAPDEGLKAKANALLAKKSYAAACPLFQKLAKASAKDGAAWADLASCLLLQKKPKDAIGAALTASRLDDADGRRSAYVTLALAGFEKKLPTAQPEDTAPKCTVLPSGSGCLVQVHVCSTAEAMDAAETHDTKSEIKIGFGLNEKDAVANKALNTFSRSQHHRSEGSDTECVLVAVDGCAKRAGYVCTTASAASAEPKTEAVEVEF